MARTMLTDAVELTAADVIHKRQSALAGDVTVGEVREWFAASDHRRLAVLADGDRYVGSVTREDVEDGDPGRPAREIAQDGPTVAPGVPASTAHERAVGTDVRRVAVVAADGVLIGVVGVTDDLAAFCGTS